MFFFGKQLLEKAKLKHEEIQSAVDCEEIWRDNAEQRAKHVRAGSDNSSCLWLERHSPLKVLSRALFKSCLATTKTEQHIPAVNRRRRVLEDILFREVSKPGVVETRWQRFPCCRCMTQCKSISCFTCCYYKQDNQLTILLQVKLQRFNLTV